MSDFTDFFASAGSNVLEHLSWSPDGRTITTSLGNKTAETITARFEPPAAWTNSAGSSIDYTPPAGTKNLLFSMTFSYNAIFSTYAPIWLTAIYIDGTQVTTSRDSHWGGSDDYYNSVMVRRCLQVGVGTEDIAAGKVGTWTSDKTLQYRIAEYSNQYDYYFGSNAYTIGGSDGSYQPPTFELMATT